MFIPNNYGKLTPTTGTSLYGDERFGRTVKVPCGIVHLNKQVQKTTVRSDSSGSTGSADEFVSSSRILFPASVQIKTGWKFEIGGITLRIVSVEPRFNVRGALDHFEADLQAWT